MRNLARPFLSAIGLVAFLTLSWAAPASAKITPFFTVAIVPVAPVAGQPLVVVVRTWSDAAHTIPAGLDAAEHFDRLLVLRPASGGSADIPIPLRFEAPDEFRATVIAPVAGDWSLIAFPDRTGWGLPEVPPGYPDTLVITVVPASHTDVTLWVVIGLAAASLAAASALAIGRRRRTGWFGSAA
jgi:hypothetical protein